MKRPCVNFTSCRQQTAAGPFCAACYRAMTRATRAGRSARLPSAYVTVIEQSDNAKLSASANVSATHAPQVTCPGGAPGDRHACALRGCGCYAERGHQRYTTDRLNRAAGRRKLSAGQMRLLAAREEARGIRALSGTRQLRVHVVGDCSTPRDAGIVGSAMVAHTRRFGQAAWTYTEAWRTVQRRAWRGATVIASVRTIADIATARARGYAAAITLTRPHTSNKVYQVGTEHLIPCPAQFKHKGQRIVTCEHCSLCKRPDYLLENKLTIAFEPDRGSAGQLVIALTPSTTTHL